VVGFDPVVRVLLGVVKRGRDQLIDGREEGPGPIGDDLDRLAMGAKRRREESSRGASVAPGGDVDVDDLAVLINRAVDVPPPARDLHIGLVHIPTVADRVAARPRRIREERREALHPAVDGDVIDLDSALAEEFFDISIREPVPQIPAESEDDDLGGNRQPLNAELGTTGNGLERRGLIPAPSPPAATLRQCNSPRWSGAQRDRRRSRRAVPLCATLAERRHTKRRGTPNSR
jgi:hypothetical protein